MLKTKMFPDTPLCWAKERETSHSSFGQLHMIHSRAWSRLNTRREMIQKKKSQNPHSTFAGKCVSNRNELQRFVFPSLEPTAYLLVFSSPREDWKGAKHDFRTHHKPRVRIRRIRFEAVRA